MSEIRCKKCRSARFVKNGFARSHQRYKCKDCGCQFTDTPPPGVDPALKSLAIVLYGMCGVSMNKIAKMVGVSTPAVLKWVRAAGAEAPKPEPKSDSRIVMIDEMWHFVNGKKKSFGSGEPWMGSPVACSDGSLVLVATRFASA